MLSWRVVWYCPGLVLGPCPDLCLDHYCPASPYSSGGYCDCLLYQWMACLVSLLNHWYLYSILISISWGHHIHYDLEFRGFSVSESRRYAWKNRSSYCSFGAVAVALELVPLFNLLFMWTNVVGAALWVADMYEKNEAEIAKQQQQQRHLIPATTSGNTSVASIYPSVRSPSSFVPSIESEQSRLIHVSGANSSTKDGYGSTTA